MTDPRAGLENATGIDDPYIRKLCMLAFLAPDIQKAILAGHQPVGLTLGRVEQRRMLGFPPQ